jgi:hypothetical protein
MTNNDTCQSYRDAPEILYKYKSLSGESFKYAEDIIVNNRLYFSHPDQLNDPFDCKVPPNLENVTKEMVVDYLERQHATLPDCRNAIEIAIQNVHDHNLNSIKIAIQNKFQEGHLQNIGVQSFSANRSDIRMWSHYSDFHKGICIGFDYFKLLFPFKARTLYAYIVHYQLEFPCWNCFVDTPVAIVDKLFFIKAEGWNYEQEWRIVYPEQGRSLQPIAHDAIVTIHLGCEIGQHDKEFVINWCSGRKHRPKIFQMTEDKYSYSLKEEELVY